jgi:dihydroxy-acid dehydratase
MTTRFLNKFSKKVTQDITQGASQAMLYALGLSKTKLKSPFIGICSTGFSGNPCNNHLNNYAKDLESYIKTYESNLTPITFNTIGVSDGISMGTKGMNYSLPSREIISDSIEVMMHAHSYDACLAIAGCDKNLPGCLMGLIKVNRPGFVIYGGSTLPGNYKNKKVDIVDAFQSYGKMVTKQITYSEREDLIKCCIPQSGACGGMYTANTMAIAIEAMGMSMPNSSSNPALSKEKHHELYGASDIIYNMLKEDILPRDIITEKSIKNAIIAIISVGGSTNAVLHLLAISNILELDIDLNTFNNIGKNVPVIGNFKPHGDHLMYDLHKIGGTQVLLKYLLEEGLLDGSAENIMGTTLEKSLKYTDTTSLRNNQDNQQILNIKKPIKDDSHIRVFYGNLARQGAVGKITGKEGTYFQGQAKVFNSENDFIDYLESEINEIQYKADSIFHPDRKTVVVIKNQGPRGGPGMPEMLKPTSAIVGFNLQDNVAFLTDGRFSGGSHGFIIGHITPEAYCGGNIDIVINNDTITIDAINNTIDLHVYDDEINNRQNNKRIFLKKYLEKNSILKKYRINSTTASKGAYTN